MNYVALAATALRLLRQHGQTVQLQKIGAASYDTATGVNTPAATVTTDRFGAEFPLTGKQVFQGSLVEVDDTKLLLDADAAAPALKDKIVVGAVVKNIVSCKALQPGGVPVVYSLHLRKA